MSTIEPTLCAYDYCMNPLPANRRHNQRFCCRACNNRATHQREQAAKLERKRHEERVEAVLVAPVAADSPKGARVLPQASLGCGGLVRGRD